jgi:hypothetical protein
MVANASALHQSKTIASLDQERTRFPRVFYREEKMLEPLPILIANSVQIAWEYLERAGELGDAAVASRFLVDDIELIVGEESGGACCYPTKLSTTTGDLKIVARPVS